MFSCPPPPLQNRACECGKAGITQLQNYQRSYQKNSCYRYDVRTAYSKTNLKKKKKSCLKTSVLLMSELQAAVIEYNGNWTLQLVFVTPPGRPWTLAFP